MTKPILNFVWVGPPRFDQGGQDVVGPETIDANFKAFPELNNPSNPMVFWCQTAYVENYQDYFTSKGITIQVASIEDYLKTCETERDKAEIILQHYRELIEDPKRNQILDRVYMKDMFFNFILATQGGYVLDTNVQAISLKTPVNFPAYDKFMLPSVMVQKGGSTPDVWMQYVPSGNLARATQCLDCYLRLYQEAKQDYKDKLYTKKHHDLVGTVAVNAACLLAEIVELNARTEGLRLSNTQNEFCGTWSCGPLINGTDALITDLGVSKEYTNTHRINREHVYGGPHIHVYNGNLEKLRFDLAHGINPDLEANPRNDLNPTGYDAYNETLLHIATRYSNEEAHRHCAQLLLTHGADANKIHSIHYKGESNQQESPLTYSIKCSTEEAVRVLFDYATTPVNVHQLLNNESPLRVAVQYENGVNLLLEHGADPNQSWPEQTDTPLACAVRAGSVANIDLLLREKADPNTPVSHNDTPQREKQTISETPLHIALRNKDASTVQKLLKHGADPLAVTKYKTSWGNVIKKQANQITTDVACSQALEAAIKSQPVYATSSRHTLFKPAQPNPVSETDKSELPSNESPTSEGSKKPSDTDEKPYRPFTPPQ